MAVSTTNAVSGPYNANGATTVFPFTFTAPSETEVAVVTRDTDGVDTVVSSSLYTVSIDSGSGGSVTFSNAPASGLKVLVYLDPSFTQEIEFENGSAWLAEPVNEGYDRSALRDQVLKRESDRSFKVPLGEAGGSVPLAATRAGKFFGFDGEGSPVALSGTGADAGLREDLAASTGSSLVGFIQDDAAAIATNLEDKGRERWSVLDFGADPTGVTDSTDAFNLATSAAAAHTGNDTTLKRQIFVPRGHYKLGADNKTVYVRKGQHLMGEGLGCYLDMTDAGANTEPVIRLGCGIPTKDTAGGDAGGLGSEISGFWIEGGPAAEGCISTDQQAGWWIHDCFFTSPGIGVLASGGDGLISNCQFDQGLVGVRFFGSNILVTGCNFYFINYGVIAEKAVDCFLVGCQFEYPIYAGVQLGTGNGADDLIKGFAVRCCTMTMNAQFGTFEGYISVQTSSIQVQIHGNEFRNCPSYAIRWNLGTGNELAITSNVFDSRKSLPAYTQGTTMGGVYMRDATVRMGGNTFRNMLSYAVEMPSGGPTVIVSQSDCHFSNAGPQVYNILNVDGTSQLHIQDHFSDRVFSGACALVNAQGTVPVYAEKARSGRVTLVAGSFTAAFPEVRDSSNVKLFPQTVGGTAGFRYEITRTAGTSFTITSKDASNVVQGLDTSVIYYELDLNGI